MRKDLAGDRKIRVRGGRETARALALRRAQRGRRQPQGPAVTSVSELLDARSELGRKRARPILAAWLSDATGDGNLGCAGSLERTRLWGLDAEFPVKQGKNREF